MAHGLRCKCSLCGRRGALEARRWALKAVAGARKPGRLGLYAKALASKVPKKAKAIEAPAKGIQICPPQTLAKSLVFQDGVRGSVMKSTGKLDKIRDFQLPCCDLRDLTECLECRTPAAALSALAFWLR